MSNLIRAGLSRAVLLLIAAGLPAMPVVAQQPPSPEYLAAQTAAATSWPHTTQRDGATVTVYQPQAIAWPERRTLTARTAVAIVRTGQTKPLLGTIELTLATRVDEAAGVVHLANPVLLATHFPSLETEQAGALEAKIRAAITQIDTKEVPLAAVLLSLKQLPVASVAVSNDPPIIFYADRLASLVVFDGEPVLTPTGAPGLSFAVNTNWDVFVDHDTWYLLNNGFWYSAPQSSGPYTPVAHLPVEFNALPKSANFRNVSQHMPAKAPTPKDPVAKIFVSRSPPKSSSPTGRRASARRRDRVAARGEHTEHPVFPPGSGLYYLQLSGRWFSAAGSAGPGNSPPINCRRTFR